MGSVCERLTILFDGFKAATACQKLASISASEIVSTTDFEYPKFTVNIQVKK